MKKGFFVLALLVGVVFQANAQEKGRFWVGGNFNFLTTDQEDDMKTTSFSVSPEFGYSFSERWAAGIRFGYSQTKIDYEGSQSSQKVKNDKFTVAPFARYTCFTWKRLNLFVDGGLSYAREKGKTEHSNHSDNNTGNYVGIFINPGLSLRLSNCISMVGYINFFNAHYQKRNYTSVNYPDSKTYQANLNSPFNLNNFSLGFNFRF